MDTTTRNNDVCLMQGLRRNVAKKRPILSQMKVIVREGVDATLKRCNSRLENRYFSVKIPVFSYH